MFYWSGDPESFLEDQKGSTAKHLEKTDLHILFQNS
jgi:hypothetical protein